MPGFWLACGLVMIVFAVKLMLLLRTCTTVIYTKIVEIMWLKPVQSWKNMLALELVCSRQSEDVLCVANACCVLHAVQDEIFGDTDERVDAI